MAPRTIFDVEVRDSEIEGAGVFAKRVFADGEFIGIISGVIHEAVDEECMYALTFGDSEIDVAVEPFWPFKYLNHANDPNTNGEIILRAVRRIEEGEEISMSYGEDWEDG